MCLLLEPWICNATSACIGKSPIPVTDKWYYFRKIARTKFNADILCFNCSWDKDKRTVQTRNALIVSLHLRFLFYSMLWQRESNRLKQSKEKRFNSKITQLARQKNMKFYLPKSLTESYINLRKSCFSLKKHLEWTGPWTIATNCEQNIHNC